MKNGYNGQDAYSNLLQIVEEPPILIDRSAFNQGVNAQYDTHISDDPVTPSLVARGPHAVATYVKAKRAQSTSDDETWVEGDINPTINQFDQGDVRATTAIVMRQREGKPGGGKGPLLSEDKSLTLAAAGNDKTLFVETIPIQDGREIDKNQNGLGIAESGAPAYTLDQTGAQSVAIGIQGNVIGRQDHNGPAGKGHTDEGDPMFTLNTTDRHAVIQYDGYNQRIYEDDVSVTIRIGRDSSDCIAQPTAAFKPGASAEAHGIGYEEEIAPSLEGGGGGNNKPAVLEPTMSVRRLTPLECERLMGWPDDWTAGQADTHRYKQCGNGVASPVAQWIGEQILNIPQ